MYEHYSTINKAKDYSEQIILNIKNELRDEIVGTDFCVVTTGSYARNEASVASDLDCFIIIDDKTLSKDSIYFNQEESNIEIKQDLKDLIEAVTLRYIKKEAGDTGTFGIDAVTTISDMITNIGGTDDDNIKFTRRMLFLLEGKCLFDCSLFNSFRERLIGTYIKETVSDYQLSRFFLNDIIRFYRTMTTDFEHKTSEKGKSWGVRNIKLTFSRKLLYFGGVLVVAETAQKTRKIKISETLRLLDMTPLERINNISYHQADKVLKHYDYFLEKISDQAIRDELDKALITNSTNENPPIFREMKNESKHFSWALSNMLKQTYDETHPIHHALLF